MSYTVNVLIGFKTNMGSLEGHLLPGTFFIVFGFWWTYALFDRYFKVLVDSTLTKIPKDFECTASYSRIEGFVKIISSIIGIVCEYWTALDKNYEFVNIGNSQHMTMYIFFLINVYNGYPLPNGSDYMSLFIATAVETLLFCFHLHGRTSLDIHVHTLLIISIIASMVSVVIEWKYRNHMLSAFSRALCALMQGFWFYTVGFILYPPFSSGPIEESHRKQMLITALFCWQIAVIIALMKFVIILRATKDTQK
ncbi:unnamed protein product [Oppiella nova]|uniref:Transmembrane protein 45B n=1 Tax=Oppiella nova TaxID=334625 RepID=A0A7R9M1Y1_9ACAR|nr:unnamed protein product [Oppiella nova]CAG2169199.1 unnamed protein product [Oppiella nova]